MKNIAVATNRVIKPVVKISIDILDFFIITQ